MTVGLGGSGADWLRVVLTVRGVVVGLVCTVTLRECF